ncbi:MAG: Xaa-Pro aminopeptidase [Rhodothermales bacterium]|jgi:Xaa-Pro aminopeptidase
MLGVMVVSLILLTGCEAPDQAQPTGLSERPVRGLFRPSAAELDTRRSALMQAHPDGLILFAANAQEKTMEQPAWIQDPSFQYFAGLADVPGAIVVVDAPAQRTVLFVPPAPSSFGIPIGALSVEEHPELAAGGDFSEVLPNSRFVAWMTTRLAEVGQRLYLDAPRRAIHGGTPSGMVPVQGTHALWEASLREALPKARLYSAAEIARQLRWVKSEGEVAELRLNAIATAQALTAGMRAVGPGVPQRLAEAAVVSGCLEAGANGPSFWPWMMSGPNAGIGNVVRSFFDYGHINRRMQAGEVVRADVGCMGGGYGGDVGRTVPVDASFSTRQAQIWDLLVTGYLAGVAAMAPGLALDDVREASRKGIEQAALENSDLKSLADAMNLPSGVSWHIHGVGIESGETAGGDLAEGVVLAYEPMFVSGGDAFYLEDMILITATGSEVLSKGLPYSAEEMKAFLKD